MPKFGAYGLGEQKWAKDCQHSAMVFAMSVRLLQPMHECAAGDFECFPQVLVKFRGTVTRPCIHVYLFEEAESTLLP